MTRTRAASTTLLIAYAVVFIAFTDNFSMFPTIGPYAQHLGGDALAMGVAVAAYSVTNLLFNIVGGIMLDRSGRRRLLLLGLIFAALAMLLYTAVSNVTSLVLVRLIHGAAGGILVPAVFTMIADLAPAGGGGRAMGRAGALIGAVAIFAPAMAGIVRQAAGFNLVFYISGALLAIGAALAAFGLPETRRRRESAPENQQRETGQVTVKRFAVPRGTQAAYWGIFTLMFAMGSLTTFLPEMAESLGHRAGTSGMLFTIFGLVAALLMISPLAQLVDRRGGALPAGAGVALMIVSLVLLMFATSLAWIIVACAIFGAGYGLIFPATSGQIAQASEGRRGRAYGMFYAAFSLGIVAGAPLGGWMKATFPTELFPFLPAFLPALIMSAVSLVVITLIGRRTAPAPTLGDASAA